VDDIALAFVSVLQSCSQWGSLQTSTTEHILASAEGMKRRQWYRARIRWAEMVEGRGIRDWEEGLYLFRSEDRETAFVRALEIGEGGQSGGEEEGRHTRWVETRLAEVVTLDCLGSELEEEPLEVHWMRLPATEKIAFDHKFEPAKRAPPVSR
jgi:hypothetical protein